MQQIAAVAAINGDIHSKVDLVNFPQVWTRNHSQVRSILAGFLHAYDHHFNLAMADVDEVLLLPASIKTPILHPVARRGPKTPPGSPAARMPTGTPGSSEPSPASHKSPSDADTAREVPDDPQVGEAVATEESSHLQLCKTE